MSQGAGGLRRSTALQLSIRTASIALLLTSTGRELVETERRHIRRPVEAAQTPKLGGYQTVDDGRGVRPRGFMLAIVRIAPAEVVRLAMAARFGCARAAEPAHEFRDAIWQQAKEKRSPKTGIASTSTERLMCGAPSPSTFARLGMNGRCHSFPPRLRRTPSRACLKPWRPICRSPTRHHLPNRPGNSGSGPRAARSGAAVIRFPRTST